MKEDVNVEAMEEITQDLLQRLIYRVDNLLETADKLAQCRSLARLTVAAWEAVPEIQCTEI